MPSKPTSVELKHLLSCFVNCSLILHVDAGLLNAGGGIHNIARARCPMLIFSGMSALTIQGEKRGSRTEFINWVQDVHDMPGIVRNYSKYSYEFRTGANISQVTMREPAFTRNNVHRRGID